MRTFRLEDLPDLPADHDIGVLAVAIVLPGLPLLHVLEDPLVLFEGVVDPDREHPVRHLVVPGILDLREPPDAPLGDAADLEFPVGGHRLVLDAHPEVRGCGLEDLLKVIGEGDIIEEEDGSGLEAAVVVEGLVRDRAGEAVLLRDLLEHGGAGVALPLPGVPGDGDVEAVRVLDRLGRKRHHETFRDCPVADMGFVEGVEEEREGVAVLEDLSCPAAVLIIHRCQGRGRCGCCLRPLPFVPPPELRPPLGPPAAGRVVAAGEDGAVRELDRKGAVLVG